MNYKTTQKETFLVHGLQIKLTTSQSENLVIITKHWQYFNYQLKTNQVKLENNWLKYAITKKINNEYFYLIAIPYQMDIVGFKKEEIIGGDFICFEHKGALNLIKFTILNIYKSFIPNSNFKIDKNRRLIHFEQYDYRFKWNKSNSIIEIYLPVQ